MSIPVNVHFGEVTVEFQPTRAQGARLDVIGCTQALCAVQSAEGGVRCDPWSA